MRKMLSRVSGRSVGGSIRTPTLAGALGCAATIGFLAVPAGCSSGSVGGTSTDAGVDGAARLAEARAELTPLADAACSWIFHCCDGDERALQIGAATSSNCSDLLLQSEALGQLGGYGQTLAISASAQSVLAQLDHLGASSARTDLDPAALLACAQSIAQAPCASEPSAHCEPMPPAPSGDPCDPQKVLVGEQQLGEACDPSGFECGPGLTCTNPNYDIEGVCVPEPAVGDLCLTDGACAPSFVCDWSSGTCVTGAAYGAPCSYAEPSNPIMGTEKVRCQVGLVCDTVTFECADPDCAGGSSCTVDAQCPVGTACLASVCGVLAQIGQPCTDLPLGPCVGGFCSNGTCVSGVCSGDTCFNGAGVGAVCSVDADCQPAAGLLCNAGSCTLVPVTSASCSSDQDCAAGSYCSLSGDGSGGCVPKKPAGALCDSYDECWGGCEVIFGQQRCFGSGPGDPMCHG
jgi:hypothetical protein